jgi:hypothetical protein
MSIIEPAVIPEAPLLTTDRARRWMTAEKYLFIVGIAIVALYGLARYVYEPSMSEKESAMQTAMSAEHANVCDVLSKPTGGPERDNCLKLLDALLATHRQALFADSGEI